MDRVVVLGRGGAGKSVLAGRIAERTGAPVVELDALYWTGPGLAPLDRPEWTRRQRASLRPDARWVADGDLGPHDDLAARLPLADTVVLLDLALPRCAFRALRRGREGIDFWRWVVAYRLRWRPAVLAAVREHAPDAELVVLRHPRAVAAWLATLG